MSSISFRRCTDADYEGIVNIRECFGGYDYIPPFYRDFMKNPNFYGFVACVNDHIVSFSRQICCYVGFELRLLLDNYIVYAGGARFHDDVIDQGLLYRFTNYVDGVMLPLYHNKTRIIFASFRHGYQQRRIHLREVSVLSRRRVQDFYINNKDVFLQESAKNAGKGSLGFISRDKFLLIVADDATRARLFPDGWDIILRGHAYNVTVKNLESLTHMLQPEIFCTFTTAGEDQRLVCRSFSFLLNYRSQKPEMVSEVSFHGDYSKDIKDHILACIQRQHQLYAYKFPLLLQLHFSVNEDKWVVNDWLFKRNCSPKLGPDGVDKEDICEMTFRINSQL